MQIKEVMSTDFKIIKPSTTFREAAELMKENECGYLPVGKDDKLTGAVTDRDIIVRGIAAGLNPDNTAVDSVMTQKIQYCFENDDVEDAAERMKKEQIRRLVVLNDEKRMTGVVTLGDIARTCNDKNLTGDIECQVAKAH